MYFYHYSVFAGRAAFVEAIYVEPRHQNKGIGKRLWKSVVQVYAMSTYIYCIFSVTVLRNALFRLLIPCYHFISTMSRKTGLDEDCHRCIFHVFGWNDKAVQFYKKCGAVDFTSEKDEHVFHMTKEDMVRFTSS